MIEYDLLIRNDPQIRDQEKYDALTWCHDVESQTINYGTSETLDSFHIVHKIKIINK